MNGFLRMLVRNRVISTRVALTALAIQRQMQTPIGQLARQHGLLTQGQVLEILERQQAVREGYTPFGQIAIELGLLTTGDVSLLLEEQRFCRPSLTSILAQRSGLSQEWLDSAAKHYASAHEGVQLDPSAPVCERPAMEPGRRLADADPDPSDLRID